MKTLTLLLFLCTVYGVYRVYGVYGVYTDYTDYVNTGTNIPITNSCVGNNQTEYNALLSLYSSTNGKNWMTNSWIKNNWNTTSDYCSWIGVVCNCYGNLRNPEIPFAAVLSVSLSDYNLVGKLPNDIGNLSYLYVLDVSYNYDLTGDLPTTISNLHYAISLRFGKTRLNGKIQTNMFADMFQLAGVMLGPSDLYGDIGDFYNGCSQLLNFDIECTGITSVNLNNCSTLQTLSASNSPLKSISNDPNSLCNFINLTNIYIKNTELNSNIINLNCLSELPNLYLVDASYNSFSGPVPNATSVSRLVLSNNEFTSIPNLSPFTNLTYLDLSYNKLQDAPKIIPYKLTTLLLNNNNITADIGHFIQHVYWTTATFVNISNNHFYGYFGASSNSVLQVLDMRYNPEIMKYPGDVGAVLIDWDYTMPYVIVDNQGHKWLCPSGMVIPQRYYQCYSIAKFRIYVDPTYEYYETCSSLKNI